MSENQDIPSCPLHLRVYQIFNDYKNNYIPSGCPLQIGGGYDGLTPDEYSIVVPRILDDKCNEGCRKAILKQYEVTRTWIRIMEDTVKRTRLGVDGTYPIADLVLYHLRGPDYEMDVENDLIPFYTDLSYLNNYHVPPHH